jgi:hypothetical protein
VNQAAQLCQISANVPDRLRDCISELERESDHAKSMLADEQNEARILDCVDHLEDLGDRTMQACRHAGRQCRPRGAAGGSAGT